MVIVIDVSRGPSIIILSLIAARQHVMIQESRILVLNNSSGATPLLDAVQREMTARSITARELKRKFNMDDYLKRMESYK
ncbi:MAG: hypothetical protein A2176_12390 [Spirochaetes bacterium RBG_13_51_14]|nr:MAG: hypothetical protein A2176_12390 [Spirochaetes bacterium RBG_13_51_14]